MEINISKCIAIVFILGIIAFNSQIVNAARFSFKQTGFHGTMENSDTGEITGFKGGLVTGSFTAEDIAGNFDEQGRRIPDGKIIVCYGRNCPENGNDKVNNISIHFSGNEAFDKLNYKDDPSDFLSARGLSGVTYDPLGNFFEIFYGDFNGLFQYPSRNTSLSGDTKGQISWAYGLFASTEEPLQISQVPLPNILGLFVFSALGMISRNRRNLNTSHLL